MALCAPGYRGSLAKFAQFSCKLASDFVVISEATIFNGTIVLPVTGVLWKRPPRKCLKNCFWGISVLFWEIPQNWKRVRDFRIFLRGFPIFKVEVFPLFFSGISAFFWDVSVLKKVFKLYLVEAFPPLFKGVSVFFWGVCVFFKKF